MKKHCYYGNQRKNLNSYLSKTFSFTECLRKKHAGHRFFLLGKKNKVFPNPHGSTILKIKNILVYIMNNEKKKEAGTKLHYNELFFHRSNAPVLLTHHQKGVNNDFFSLQVEQMDLNQSSSTPLLKTGLLEVRCCPGLKKRTIMCP